MFDLVRAPGFPQFLQLFLSRSIIRKLSKESLYLFLFFSPLVCLDKKKTAPLKYYIRVIIFSPIMTMIIRCASCVAPNQWSKIHFHAYGGIVSRRETYYNR